MEEGQVPAVFRLDERQWAHIAVCLGHIDRARIQLEQKGPGNEAICEELKTSSEGIYHLINSLEEIT